MHQASSAQGKPRQRLPQASIPYMPGKVSTLLSRGLAVPGVPTDPNPNHLPSSERLWPDFEQGPWLLHFDWCAIEGRAECVGFAITSVVPEGHRPGELVPPAGSVRRLSAQQIRDVPLGALVEEERPEWAAGWRALGQDDIAGAFAAPRGRRHPHDSPDRLRQAAEVYRQAFAAGQPPTKAVEEALVISRSGAGKLVARARAAGLLPPTSQGRPRVASAPIEEDPGEQ